MATIEGVSFPSSCLISNCSFRTDVQQCISWQRRRCSVSELHHEQHQIVPGSIKPAPRRAWRCVRKATRAFPINVFLDNVTTDQRMQRGMKPRKLAHEFRNGLDDDSLILLKNGRVKLRMAERSAHAIINRAWRLARLAGIRARTGYKNNQAPILAAWMSWPTTP